MWRLVLARSSQQRRAPRLAGPLALAVLLAIAAPALSQSAFEPAIYRIFLKSGTPLVSWGEFSRIGDRIAFTLPVGDPRTPDKLQLVSLPADVIDWDRTNNYADSVRYQRYAATRGDRDYKALTDDIARALTEIAFTKDSAVRLAAAEDARRRLMKWPAEHFGYRASEVRDLASVVDEAVAAVGVGSGDGHFNITLVATMEPPAAPLMPAPSARDAIEMAAAAARVSDRTPDRLALQQAILASLAVRQPALSPDWVSATRKQLTKDMKAASRVDQQYAKLSSRTTSDAAKRAANADVEGVEHVLADARAQDAKLGTRRPVEMSALVASLEASLEAARQHRLEIDRWRMREHTYRAYRNDIERHFDRLRDITKAIEKIRAMSGPDADALSNAGQRAAETARMLVALPPPEGLRTSHDALVTAVQLMMAAIDARRAAVAGADLDGARNASAAAAGSLLLLDRAREEIAAFFRQPKLP